MEQLFLIVEHFQNILYVIHSIKNTKLTVTKLILKVALIHLFHPFPKILLIFLFLIIFSVLHLLTLIISFIFLFILTSIILSLYYM